MKENVEKAVDAGRRKSVEMVAFFNGFYFILIFYHFLKGVDGFFID